MQLEGLRVGVAICASCCTYHKATEYIKQLIEEGAEVTPILSTHAQIFNSRFGTAEDLIQKLTEITGKKPLGTIVEVEPLGPQGLLDVIIIMPCTGNTLAKLANAIIDTPVTMAAKSMLRNERPVVIALTTNDALGLNMKNLGTLMNTKHVYFVPLGQDNPEKKPNSLSADFTQIIPTTLQALEGTQLQPVMVQPNA